MPRMFTAEGEVVQPSDVLYKKTVLVERGSFRPVTNTTLDMLERAQEQFLLEPEMKGEEPVVLMEMTCAICFRKAASTTRIFWRGWIF